MNIWATPADNATLERTAAALKANNFDVTVAVSGEEAKKIALEMLPAGAEVFTLQSQTLRALGLFEAIDDSGNYDSIRKKFATMDWETNGRQMRKLGSSPDWAIGSVHAVTQDGHIMIASNTGSQLAADVSGAGHVIWIVGTQKIVKNIDEGFKRIYEHCLQLESERLKKMYPQMPGSEVKKILIEYKEFRPGRTTIIFVKEALGF